MGLIVSINNVCVVDGEQDWEFLNCYVMQYLIIGVLQEGGVDCDNGFVFINGQFCSKGYCVLFGNCYIKIVIWEFMRKFDYIGIFMYCWSNCYQFVVFCCCFV